MENIARAKVCVCRRSFVVLISQRAPPSCTELIEWAPQRLRIILQESLSHLPDLFRLLWLCERTAVFGGAQIVVFATRSRANCLLLFMKNHQQELVYV